MPGMVVAVVVTALFFDFTNGFHDTANAMATSIATGALKPRVAVVLAGVLNLVGAFLSVEVAAAHSPTASPPTAPPTSSSRASGARRCCPPPSWRWRTAPTTVILSSATLGFALSTTQVATGSIFGASAGRPCCPVQWGTAGKMALSWLLTLPAAAAVAALAAWVASTGVVGTVAVAAALVVLAGTMFLVSRRNPVTSTNVNDVEPAQPAAAAAP